MKKDELKENQIEKLQFIEIMLYFYGIVSRDNIMKKFNLSSASATNILSKYNQIAPKNLVYNIKLKSYEISQNFKPTFEMQIFLEHIPLYTIPTLNQEIDPNEIDRVAIISRAIQRIHSLKITYTSISSGTSIREIVPVAFANNRIRWHLRAYDRKRESFLDFVFKKISKVEQIENDTVKEYEHPNRDNEWHSFVELKIKSRMHGLKDVTISVRKAMVGYFLKFWNIDCSPEANLERTKYQYCLENLKEVSQKANLKLAPGYEC